MSGLPLYALEEIQRLLDTAYHKTKEGVALLMQLDPPEDIVEEAEEHLEKLEELHSAFLEEPNEATVRALQEHIESWRTKDVLSRFKPELIKS